MLAGFDRVLSRPALADIAVAGCAGCDQHISDLIDRRSAQLRLVYKIKVQLLIAHIAGISVLPLLLLGPT